MTTPGEDTIDSDRAMCCKVIIRLSFSNSAGSRDSMSTRHLNHYSTPDTVTPLQRYAPLILQMQSPASRYRTNTNIITSGPNPNYGLPTTHTIRRTTKLYLMYMAHLNVAAAFRYSSFK